MVSYFSNAIDGLATINCADLVTVNEIDRANRPAAFTAFADQTVTLTTRFKDLLDTPAATFCISAMNWVGTQTTRITNNIGGSGVQVDNSSIPINVVASGTGQYPTDFGGVYDPTVSLLTNQELQYVAGIWRIPSALNYSAMLPAGSPDYTGISLGWRYVTFIFDYLDGPISNLDLRIDGATGTGWGYQATPGAAMSLTVKVVGPTEQTGWLDANAFYVIGTFPREDGDACLIANSYDGTTRQVTFIETICDISAVYVRLGIDCNQPGYAKAYKAISVSCKQVHTVLPLSALTLDLVDHGYLAQMAGTGAYVREVIANLAPRTRVVKGIDAASGVLSANLVVGTQTEVLGHLDLEAVLGEQVTTNGALIVTDKGAVDGVVYVNAAIQPTVNVVTSGTELLSYKLSRTWCARTISTQANFYADIPSTPGFSGLPTWTATGGERWLSGVKCSRIFLTNLIIN